jgi:alkylation response protein AidB-like acyl-CoA dehydrogenase
MSTDRVLHDTAEQRELRTSVRGFLASHAPVRAQLSDEGSVWPRLTTDLGLTALAVREEHGGAGAGVAELAVVLEEAGRSLLRAPLLSTSVAAALLQDLDVPDLLVGLLDGSTPVALAVTDGAELGVDGDRLSGVLPQVVDAPGAGLLLVAAQDALHAVDLTAGGVAVTPLETLDPTRPQGRVELDGASARRLGGADAAGRAADLLNVALAAECVGAAQRCVEMTVDHLKVREQFGRPLGSFQALRHRVADMTVQVEAARSSAWYAARAADGAGSDLAIAAPLAKATAADAFVAVAGETIQLHGGIGFTWEHDAHLYFKRAWTTALLHGDSTTLRRRAFARAHDSAHDSPHDSAHDSEETAGA